MDYGCLKSFVKTPFAARQLQALIGEDLLFSSSATEFRGLKRHGGHNRSFGRWELPAHGKKNIKRRYIVVGRCGFWLCFQLKSVRTWSPIFFPIKVKKKKIRGWCCQPFSVVPLLLTHANIVLQNVPGLIALRTFSPCNTASTIALTYNIATVSRNPTRIAIARLTASVFLQGIPVIIFRAQFALRTFVTWNEYSYILYKSNWQNCLCGLTWFTITQSSWDIAASREISLCIRARARPTYFGRTSMESFGAFFAFIPSSMVGAIL